MSILDTAVHAVAHEVVQLVCIQRPVDHIRKQVVDRETLLPPDVSEHGLSVLQPPTHRFVFADNSTERRAEVFLLFICDLDKTARKFSMRKETFVYFFNVVPKRGL